MTYESGVSLYSLGILSIWKAASMPKIASLERSGSIILKVAVAFSSRSRTGGVPFISNARKRESSGSSGPCRQQLMGWEYVNHNCELAMSAVEAHSYLSGIRLDPSTPRPRPWSVRLTPVMASNCLAISEAGPEPPAGVMEVSAGVGRCRISSSCRWASSWRRRCSSSFCRFVADSLSAWRCFRIASSPSACVSTQGPSSATPPERAANTRTCNAMSAGRPPSNARSSWPTACRLSPTCPSASTPPWRRHCTAYSAPLQGTPDQESLSAPGTLWSTSMADHCGNSWLALPLLLPWMSTQAPLAGAGPALLCRCFSSSASK
mmetsp:Transcript_49146/g.136578  ORF Transcript_49146/g.136578 Transcript_49146/m.136578 type:complete len:320 (-) Transcript_49146:515-1474(-)